jgi:two-component system NtrC family response regulator
VRELENRIKRGVTLAERDLLGSQDLGLEVETDMPDRTLRAAVRRAEYDAIARAWAETDGVVSRMSRMLEVSRPTLYKLLREHGFRD